MDTFFSRWFGRLFFTDRFFVVFGALILLFLLSWLFSFSIEIPRVAIAAFGLLTLADYIFLFFGRGVTAERLISDRLSNGDSNPVTLRLHNHNPFTTDLRVIEELPVQFQAREKAFAVQLKGGAQAEHKYYLRPFERGAYQFGNIILMVRTRLCLVERKIKAHFPEEIAVYPSFIQMRKYELLARSAQTMEAGNKRMRKIGHSMEFEQIKDYVTGDDVRTLNWKATARRGSMMVNHYTDEKSQQVFCVIDKGRLMKMPFEGLTLLDYAINATLVLCNVSLHKQDRFGLITFSNKSGTVLAADRKPIQLENVLQALYKQQTQFLESDFEKLYLQTRTYIKQRSLLILFTNFESVSGMKRQLPYLKTINKRHLLLVIFFENTELTEIADKPVQDIEGVYTKTIAEKFAFEKRMIVKELARHGILSVLTPPKQLTINAVNKYLELKSRQAI